MMIGMAIGFGLSTIVYWFACDRFYRRGIKHGREIERYSARGGIVTYGLPIELDPVLNAERN